MSAFNTTPNTPDKTPYKSSENPAATSEEAASSQAPNPTPPTPQSSPSSPPKEQKKNSLSYEEEIPPTQKKRKIKQILLLAGLLGATLTAIILQKNAYVASMASTLTVAEYEPEAGSVLSKKPASKNSGLPTAPPTEPLTPPDNSPTENVEAPEAPEIPTPAETASEDSHKSFKIVRTEQSKLGSRLYIVVKNKTVLEVKRKGDIQTILEAPKGIITVSTKEIARSSLKKFAPEREKFTEKEGTKTFLEIDEIIEAK